MHLKPGEVKYLKGTICLFITYLMQVLINCQGTLPFMSLQILHQISDCDGSTINHVAADDLESFFYMFMWLCILHNGPDGLNRMWPEDDNFIIHVWGEGAMHPGGLIIAWNMKSHFIYSPNSIIDKQFTPYFNNLKPLTNEWKELIKGEDQHRQSGPSTPNMHRNVIELLHKYADNLPNFDPPSLPYQYQQSSTQLPSTVSLAVPATLKQPSPFSSKQLSKRRQCFSLGSVGTAWEPNHT